MKLKIIIKLNYIILFLILCLLIIQKNAETKSHVNKTMNVINNQTINNTTAEKYNIINNNKKISISNIQTDNIINSDNVINISENLTNKKEILNTTKYSTNKIVNYPKKREKIEHESQLIKLLNKNANLSSLKYILLFDYIDNPYCADNNAFYIFEYYMKKNRTDAYYLILEDSDLYKTLLKRNQTKNLIVFNPSKGNLYELLYDYLLYTKIIINSYALVPIQIIVNGVSYLKYLYLTHAIGYFKTKIIEKEFKSLIEAKRNIILSSPYEMKLYKEKLGYKDEYMYKAGLPRYDRFQNIAKNHSENDCILISFTYRTYDNDIYRKSLYKRNLKKLLENKSLLSFLKSKNIDLVYIQHHWDYLNKRAFNKSKFPDIKYKKPSKLSHYIEQCSLFITDFSTISFDFMFLNKPALFYPIDVNDTINFKEREYMLRDKEFFFDNLYLEQNSLIEKIKYYVNRKFKLEENLKEKYNSAFYFKSNITERIVDIIDKIIQSK